MTISMLELFKSNTLLLEQKSHESYRNGMKNIDSLINHALDDCAGRTLVNKNSTPPQPTAFEQFIAICERQFDSLEKANLTFKQMVSIRLRSDSESLLIVPIAGVESFKNCGPVHSKHRRSYQDFSRGNIGNVPSTSFDH